MTKLLKRCLSLFLSLTILATASGCGAAPKAEANAETITIVDHNDNTVVIPKKIERIVVCDILPLPSVLSVFFNSAAKIVGMSETSMSAAKSGLLGELYPEILKADTGFIKGTTVNVEELVGLKPDVVFYSAASKEIGEQLKSAGFHGVAISANKWEYNAIETLNNWISLLSQMFPAEKAKTELVANYSKETYDLIQERVANLKQEERVNVFFLFKYSDTSIMTSGKRFFGQWWADAIGAVNVAEELTTDNQAEVNMEQIYKWNPDLMFITNFTTAQPEDIINNTIGNYDWSGISAA
ncbi:MAG: ABC transporter substrate-binding protein, partial [Oscillospiraceae bacterium]